MNRGKVLAIAAIVALLTTCFGLPVFAAEVVLSVTNANNEALFKAYLEEFGSRYPDVDAILATSGSGQVLTLITAGSPPAIQKRGVETYYEMAATGVLYDVSSDLERHGVDLNAFFPAVVDAVWYKGGLYALPADGKPEVIYYNRNVLARNGIATPPVKYGDPGWTWQYLRDLARKITRDENGDGVVEVMGISGMPHNNQVGTMGSAWGARWFDNDYNYIGNSPEMRAAISFFADWAAEGTIESSTAHFTAGTAGFRIGTSSSTMTYFWDRGIDFGIAPVVTGHQATVNTDVYRFFRGENTGFALDFVLPLATDPELAAEVALVEFGVPTLRAAVPHWMERLSYPPEVFETLVSTMEVAVPRGKEYGPHVALNTAIRDAVSKVIDSREISIDQMFELIRAAVASEAQN